jgi:hypothetical protein
MRLGNERGYVGKLRGAQPQVSKSAMSSHAVVDEYLVASCAAKGDHSTSS